MSIFNKKLTATKQDFNVPITLKAEMQEEAAQAAKTLSVIASFFSTRELAAVAKALNNPAVRAIIRSKL